MAPTNSASQDADIRQVPSEGLRLAQAGTEFLRKNGFLPDGRSKGEVPFGQRQFETAGILRTPTGGRTGYRRGK